MVNEILLKEAQNLSGARTYSAVVGQALEHYVRGIKARRILELRGSGLWEGDLGEMRGDRPRKKDGAE
jgi:Bacterial antitoxin of type II TA system, VapB